MIKSDDDIDPATDAAILRMLERAPAFRAESWRWRGSMCFSVRGVGCAIAASSVGRHGGSLGVKIFRPKSKNTFVRLVGRCAR